MAQPTTDHDVTARRLSDDFIQFKTSHHLPDDLESSRIFAEDVVSLVAHFFPINSDGCHQSSAETSPRSDAAKTEMALVFPRANDFQG
jgi:hypothetical protein